MSVWLQGMMQAQQTRASDKALTNTHSCPASAQCTAFLTADCSEMHFCSRRFVCDCFVFPLTLPESHLHYASHLEGYAMAK